MAPIALSAKHQDLLKAYLEVSKSEKPDWASIADKSDYPTPKYARDTWAIVKNKLLATPNGSAIDLQERQIGLLKAVVEIMKSSVNWEEVARTAEFKTPKYARDTWAIVRNKLAAAGGDGTASPAKTPAKNKASKETPSRKRKTIEDPIEDDQEAAIDSEAQEPKPKKKARKSKVKVEEVQTGEEEEVTAATPKPEPKQNARKHARKPKAQEAGEVDAKDGLSDAGFDAAMFL
ncbi:hypothetical protein Q7P37_007049 [Cladosporium fusiforme]